MNLRTCLILPCVVSTALAGAPEPMLAGPDPTPTTTLTGAWQSRHVSEGVDQVPGQSVWTGGVLFAWQVFLFELEWIEAHGDPYREVATALGCAWEAGPITCTARITHLRFPSATGCNSWEGGVEIEVSVATLVAIYADLVYDFVDACGGMAELGVRGVLPSPFALLEIEPYALVGIDFGYVDESRRLRGNHFQAGIELTWAMNRSWSASASIHGCLTSYRLREIGGGDRLWATLGLSTSR